MVADEAFAGVAVEGGRIGMVVAGEGGFGDALVENFLRLGEVCGWDNLEWDRFDWNGFRSNDCCVLDRFGVEIGFQWGSGLGSFPDWLHWREDGLDGVAVWRLEFLIGRRIQESQSSGRWSRCGGRWN